MCRLRGESDSDCRAVASFIFPSLTRNGCPGRGRLNDAALPQRLDLRVAGGSPADPRTLLGSRRSGRCGCCKLTSMLGLTCNFVNSETLCPMKSVGTVPLSPRAELPPGRNAAMRKPKTPEANRARIIQAAIDEFAARGFKGASMDAIAARTHTTRAMINYYFGGKEKIYLAVLEHVYTGDPPGRERARPRSPAAGGGDPAHRRIHLRLLHLAPGASCASWWPRTRPRAGTSRSRRRCAL